MPARMKQAAITLVKLTLAVGLTVWMVRKGAIDFSVLRELSTPGSVAIGLGLVFALIFINNYRWLILLRAQGFATTVARTLPLSLIGIFFNYAMPGGVGGDVVKGYYLLREHKNQKVAGAVSILLDRIIGLSMMITTAAVALALNMDQVLKNAQLATLATVVFAFFIAFGVFFAVALSSWIGRTRLLQWIFAAAPGGRTLKQIYISLHSYRHRPGALLVSFLFSLLSQTMIIVLFYLVGQAMELESVSLSLYFFLVPVGLVTTSLPLSPAGIGVGQAAFYFLFNLITGQPTQVGPTAITALQIAQFFWGLFGAYFYLRRGKPKIETVASEAV
ncbi:MAG: flippase-like domain-containing protein [Bdellovibrionaceae bacterium]|nr:flippase-like domain-containing protein [Pseudobdellovibrionaceae bacterium]